MSGHSKWSTIKHKKGILDAQRGKLFSQLSKNIRVAVKEGKSGDPNLNPALRLAIEKARAANMSKEKIQKAIDRGLGKTASGASIQEVVYEGFGPQGIGLIVVAMTDNPQRTSSSIKTILHKAGGSMGGPNTVMYMFKRSGEEYLPTMPMQISDQKLISQLEKLMDDLRNDDDVEDVFCAAVWEKDEA